MTRARRIPVPEQLRRTAELDRLRLIRPLNAAEHAEADHLADLAYHRSWRAQMAEQERRLAS